jgi:O-antigen/teichoic acid export membrane protein
MSRRVATNAGWSAVGRLGSQALQFAAGLALARLLLPADFGLLAGVYVVTGFTVIFFDLGLNGALVHRRELDEEMLSTAFWLNALGGVVFVALMAAVGPLVASFYGDSRLRWITPLAGLSFALSLAVVHSALLQRDLRFKRLAVAEVAAALAGNVVTIVCASAGMGPYALITGPAVQSVLRTVILWVLAPWRPRYFISLAAVRSIWSFSGGLLGFTIVNYTSRNADNLLIGRFSGAAALGYYNRAYSVMLLPLLQIGNVVGRVMFPALALISADLDRVRKAYRRVLRLMTLLTMPILVGMAACAPALVTVLWGPGWEPAAPLLQVLCLAGLPQCLFSSEGWLYQSQGRTRLMFGMGVASSAAFLVGIVAGIHWGPLGVAVGILVVSYVFLPINLTVACSTIGLRVGAIYRDNAATFGLSVLMGGVVWSIPLLTGTARPTAWLLPLQVGTGLILYGVSTFAFQRDLLRELVAVGRRNFAARPPG